MTVLVPMEEIVPMKNGNVSSLHLIGRFLSDFNAQLSGTPGDKMDSKSSLLLKSIIDILGEPEVSKDDQKRAFELVLGQQSNAMANVLLGFFYEFGVGTDVDCPKAESLYLKLVDEKESPSAQVFALCRLVDIYSFGAPGCRLDAKRAGEYFDKLQSTAVESSWEWLEKAAETWPLAEYALAKCQLNGWGIQMYGHGARTLLRHAAGLGESFSQAALAVQLANPYMEGALKESTTLISAAVENSHDARILFALGSVHEDIGEYEQAVDAFKQSADSGHPLAWLRLGNLYKDAARYNQKADFEEAVKYYNLAGDWGCGEAFRLTGRLHEMGLAGGVVDFDKAKCCYERAAALGDKDSIIRLESWSSLPDDGDCSEGLTVFEEVKRALLNAQAGDHQAEYSLGCHYEDLGDGATEIAVEWFRRAHEGGNLNATYKLSSLLKWDSKSRFYNLDEARELAEIVVKEAYPDNRPVTCPFDLDPADAKCLLGDVYQLQGNISAAAHWYAESILEGSSWADMHLDSLIEKLCKDDCTATRESVLSTVRKLAGTLSEYGKRKKAFDAWMLGATLGDPMCMRKVGECLLGGVGVKRDPEEAIKWLTKAGDLKDVGACLTLFNIYHHGVIDHVQRDPVKAAAWIEKAKSVDPNDPAVQYNMGLHLLSVNRVENALEWLGKSSKAGYKPAVNELSKRKFEK